MRRLTVDEDRDGDAAGGGGRREADGGQRCGDEGGARFRSGVADAAAFGDNGVNGGRAIVDFEADGSGRNFLLRAVIENGEMRIEVVDV